MGRQDSQALAQGSPNANSALLAGAFADGNFDENSSGEEFLDRGFEGGEREVKTSAKENFDAKNTMLAPSAKALDKPMLSRATLASFAQQIKESIKNYKPPLTKLSLDLNPKNLGKIELTIAKKGKDLQINITSNPQAITLFAQNQADLKHNLQNVGFNQVDFNFSQNSSSQNQSRQQKRNKNSLQQYQEVNNITQPQYDALEITLPKYA